MTRQSRRLALIISVALLLAAAGPAAWADPARSVWVPPDSGYINKPGLAEWGWPACSCNPKEYKGQFCAEGRDPGCGGDPGSQGSSWEWEERAGYWTSHPPATVAGSLSCTLGLGGWCVSAATVTVSGSEPVAGYSITSIQGTDAGAPYSQPGALAVFNFGDTPGRRLTYQAFSSYGDSSYTGSTLLRVDTTAPNVSAAVSGLAGLGGWYRGPVQVSVSASDATSGVSAVTLDGAAYFGPKTYSAQGANAYSYSAQDAAGNASGPQTGTIWIDSIPPAAAPSLSGTAGAAGWFISPVQVTLTGSDTGSGLAGLSLDGLAYAGPRTYSAQGSQTFTYAAGDAAGNSSGTQTGTLRIDTAAPAVSAAQAGTPGAGGWYVSPVVVTVNASDAASGIVAVTLDGSAYAGPRTYTGQGTTTFTYSARDLAGLSSATQNGSFKIDTVPPAASLAVSGPAGANGWYTGSVQVTVSGADAASGLAGLTMNGTPYAGPRQVSAEGQTTLTYAAMDNAGNPSGAQSAVVKIDSLPPDADYALAGTAGANGWFVSPVQVTVTGSDAASGVAGLTLDGAPYAGPRTYAAEGGTTITYAARDVAGNAGATETATFQVDTVAPVVSATITGPAGDAGWYTGPVTVEVNGIDATSGLAALRLDEHPYSGPREYAAEGATTVAYAGRDVAGNVSAGQTETFRIDATAPALDLDWAGTPGRNGWYVSPVTVSLSGSDAVSGLAGLELDGAPYTGPQVLGAEGLNTVDYAGWDVAGNQAAGSRAFHIDTQPPAVSATLTGAAGLAGWYVSPVTLTVSGSDATAGLDSLSLNGAPYTGPWVIQAQGETAFTFNGHDLAGNGSELLAGQVRIDTAAPVVTATLTGQAGLNGWYVSPVTVTLAAGDAVSGLAGIALDGAAYAGPRAFTQEGLTTLRYLAADVAGNRSPAQTRTFQIDTRPPATRPALIGLPGRGGWYLGPVLVLLSADDVTSGVDHILLDGTPYTGPRLFAAGTVTATYQAVDQAGNFEPARTLVFNADGTPPMTTATLGGTRGEAGWFTSAVTVTLAAQDDVSGVAQVWLNGRPENMLALDTDGPHSVEFAAEDLAGNREITQTLTVRIDRTPPAVAVQATSQTNGTIALDVHAHDAGSGVQGGVVGILAGGQLVQWWNFAGESAQVEWDGALPDGRVLPPGTYTVWAAARDAAGLEATASTGAVLAPAATLPPPPPTPPPPQQDAPPPTRSHHRPAGDPSPGTLIAVHQARRGCS